MTQFVLYDQECDILKYTRHVQGHLLPLAPLENVILHLKEQFNIF